MSWRAFILVVVGITVTLSAGAVETEIIPCKTLQFADELPYCCLKQTDTEYILYKGDKVLKHFAYTYGPNLVFPQPVHENSLNIALQTLKLLRETGACR